MCTFINSIYNGFDRVHDIMIPFLFNQIYKTQFNCFYQPFTIYISNTLPKMRKSSTIKIFLTKAYHLK